MIQDNLIEIKEDMFDKAFCLVFDLLSNIYKKGGIAYLEQINCINNPLEDFQNHLISVLQNGYSPEALKLMLDLIYVKMESQYTLTLDEKYIIKIFIYLSPFIQDMDTQFIIDFQNYFCSSKTIFSNISKIKEFT